MDQVIKPDDRMWLGGGVCISMDHVIKPCDRMWNEGKSHGCLNSGEALLSKNKATMWLIFAAAGVTPNIFGHSS